MSVLEGLSPRWKLWRHPACPYREGWGLDRVISHIEHEAGHQFDPRVVEAFLWIMDSRGRGVAHVSEQALSIAL